LFWALVQQGGLSNHDAQETLKGTFSADKHELLFSRFSINYNNESEQFKKGTVLVREKVKETTSQEVVHEDGTIEEKSFSRAVTKIQPQYVDIIGKEFWKNHPDIIGDS